MAISGARVRRLRRLRGLREDRLRDRRYASKPRPAFAWISKQTGCFRAVREHKMWVLRKHHFLDDDTGSLKVEIDVKQLRLAREVEVTAAAEALTELPALLFEWLWQIYFLFIVIAGQAHAAAAASGFGQRGNRLPPSH